MTPRTALVVGTVSCSSAFLWQDWFAALLGPEGGLWSALAPDAAAGDAAAGAPQGADLDPAQPLILVYTPVEAFAERAIAAGATPVAALQDWIAGAEALLARQRRRRRTTYLLPDTAPEHEAAALRAHLSGWLADRIGPLPEAPAELPGMQQPQAHVAPAIRLIAAHLPQASRQARRLAAELAAAGFAATPPAPGLDLLDDLHAGQLSMLEAMERQGLATITLNGQLGEAALRLDRLLAAHDSAVADLSETRARLQEAETQAAQHDAERGAEREATQAQIAALQASLQEAAALATQRTAERDSLLEQIAAAAQAHAGLTVALDLQRQDQAHLEARTGALQHMLADESLRADRLAASLAERDRQTAAQADRIAWLEDRLAARRLDRLSLRAQLADRDQSVVALSEERRFLEMDLQDRIGKLREFQDSTSWRVTAPLRATRRLFIRSRSPE